MGPDEPPDLDAGSFLEDEELSLLSDLDLFDEELVPFPLAEEAWFVVSCFLGLRDFFFFFFAMSSLSIYWIVSEVKGGGSG